MRFADGSTVVPLNGRETSFAVVEDTPQRIVVALAKGGARFDVVPRPERVFAVRAGTVTVSVLGTAFSVERVADRVGVAVTRGAVQVDWGAGARRLAAGEEGWFASADNAQSSLGTAMFRLALGELPSGLAGALYRNGPNPQFAPRDEHHWFAGDGMIHGFFIENGRARYRNRYVRTPKWRAENAAGKASIVAPTVRSVMSALTSLRRALLKLTYSFA